MKIHERTSIGGQPPDQRVAEPEIVLFFVGADGEPIEPERPPPSRTLGEVHRAWRAARDEERERKEFLRRRPSDPNPEGIAEPGRSPPRLGQRHRAISAPSTVSVLQECAYDDQILVTMRTDPVQAVTVAARGELFDPPIDRMRVDAASLEANRLEVCWSATVLVSRMRTRRAYLRLYASPSLNVCVLSLVPAKPLAIARPSFLRAGLAAMADIRDRVDARVGTRPGPGRRVTVAQPG